jgi:glutaredoxin-like protein NrdH
MTPVIVHTKPNCAQCDITKKRLRARQIPFTEEPLTDESVARFKLTGHLSAPIVTVGADCWAGFRPDKIDDLARKLAAT